MASIWSVARDGVVVRDEPSEQEWEAHDISGPRGIKYDLVELVDLDVLTTEENEINAVLWYENPSR